MEIDMALTPERILALRAASEALEAAGHGQKQIVAAEQARLLGVDDKTLYRQMREAGFGKARKRRSDAGKLSVSREEAMVLAAMKTQAQRANGKDNMAISTAGRWARNNGLAALGKVDKSTGELMPVSDATLARAMRHHGLDLKTLRQPTVHRGGRSLHPNHVWQIDASVCVLYYLDAGGLGVMEHDEFYKNKPENVQKRMKDMVIRYVCTDHYTGSVYFRYYLGAESGEMLCNFFIECIQNKGHEKDPVHGVPFIAMLDPGAANKGAMFQNLCRLLGVDVRIHRPKNPRAKGSVEKHNDLVERGFESMLIGKAVGCLEELNAEADVWRRWFNGTRPHRRHGHTRYGFWQTIRQEQLRLAPAPEVCRQLMTEQPTGRKVKGGMEVNFKGDTWDVSGVPGLNVGQDVTVAINPYLSDAIFLIQKDVNGHDVFWVCPRILLNEAGWRQDAPVIGEGFKALADTPAMKDMKALEQMAYGVEGKLAVDAARRQRKPVFGGLDIKDHLEADTPASYMPRAGTENELVSPVATPVWDGLAKPASLAVEAQPLNLVQLAGRLAAAMPGEWSPEHYQRVAEWHPAGCSESEVASVIDRLRNFTPLRLVVGA